MIGATHELAFWERFVGTEQFGTWLAPTPTPELAPVVRDFLIARPLAHVLDVGSGVVSVLRGTVADDLLQAVDPLSTEYGALFDYRVHGIEQPLPIAVEDLTWTDFFDVVHMRNALDHCREPVEGIRRLIGAARPGGWVIVQGFENEGTAQRWDGMHQWDIRTDGLDLVATGRDGRTRRLARGNRVYPMKLDTGRRWFVWMKQRGPV